MLCSNIGISTTAGSQQQQGDKQKQGLQTQETEGSTAPPDTIGTTVSWTATAEACNSRSASNLYFFYKQKFQKNFNNMWYI
jgi:hypothetical protein